MGGIMAAIKAIVAGQTAQTKANKNKSVLLFNSDGTPEGKAPLSTDNIFDPKTEKTLTETLEYLKPYEPGDDALFVDMGLPSGVKWAKKNIDATQANGFAASEYQYECTFFSWGNREGHNPSSTSAFSYNWGSANDGPYASTPGAAIEYPASAGASYDGARASAGAPWRLPTTEEFKELFDNCDFIDASGNVISSSTTDKRVTINSIVGIRLKSRINGNVLFFPCSGYGYGSSWNDRGTSGHYWSASLTSATYGRLLNFVSGGVYPQGNNLRFFGFAVRPVQ